MAGRQNKKNRGGGGGGGRGGGGGGRGGGNGGGNGFSFGGNGGGRNQPNTGNGGKNNKTCNNCHKTGHVAADCRAPKNNGNGGNGGGQKCTVCGKANHTADQCHFNKNKTQGGKGTLTRACTFCGGWHLNKDCNARDGKDAQGNPLSCKQSQGPHFNNACPLQYGQPVNNPNSNTNSNTNTGTVGYIPGNINGANAWSQQGTITIPCPFCGWNTHLQDDCPHKSAVGVNTQIDFAQQQQYQQPQPTWNQAAQFPYQPAVQPPQQSFAPKYCDDPDTSGSQYPPPSQQTAIPGYSHVSTGGLVGPYNLGLGDPPREYHRHINLERDGDVMMEDVEVCGDCEFSPEEQVEMMRKREVQAQWDHIRMMDEMRQRATRGDIRGFGAEWRYG